MLALWILLLAPQPPLSTIAEQSGFVRTGRYPEVVKLCAAFAEAYPGRVRCEEFGRSPENRPLLALVASQDGVLEPAQARARKRPVVLIQGGIHAGEIDGKDAGFWALRELVEGKAAPSSLAHATLVFVPVFNVDGHERWGKNNRPNQNGPEEMGWRVTAQNLNLNRDYMKAEAPEMHAMLGLLERWDPILYVDLHVTDGAQFRHDVAVLVDPTLWGPEPLKAPARLLQKEVLGAITQSGHHPLGFYPSFEDDDEPSSGFAEHVPTPRFSTGYHALRNRIAMLVETHSWKPYRERVKTTFEVIVTLTEAAARDGARWLEAAAAADAQASRLGGSELPVAFTPGQTATTIDFLGYAYRKAPSVLGGEVIRYDTTRPEIWKLPLRQGPRPAARARVPKAGYLVPAAWAPIVAAKLKLHGVRFEVLSKGRSALAVESFRARTIKFASTSYEGRQTLRLEGAWARDRREAPAGSLFVPIGQPLARLAVFLLDPASGDSLVAWGFLNGAFERQEYIESYVLEDFAQKALKDPRIKAEWEKRARDPNPTKDAEAGRELIYRHHPGYDERFGLYPVFKLDKAP